MQGRCQRTRGAIRAFSMLWKLPEFRLLLQSGKMIRVGTPAFTNESVTGGHKLRSPFVHGHFPTKRRTHATQSVCSWNPAGSACASGDCSNHAEVEELR